MEQLDKAKVLHKIEKLNDDYKLHEENAAQMNDYSEALRYRHYQQAIGMLYLSIRTGRLDHKPDKEVSPT